MRGWVYIIINESMPGLVKVGFSMKDPVNRAKELDNTNNPLPFKLVYDALVYNPHNIEQQSHKELKEKKKAKEWFQCEINYAISIIREISGENLITELIHIAEENNEIEDNIFQEIIKPLKSFKNNEGEVFCPNCRTRNTAKYSENIIECKHCHRSIKC